VAALVMAACGGGGGGDSDTAAGREYVDAIVADNADEDPPLDEDEVRCAAERWVDLLGTEAFEKAGVTPEDIGAASDDDTDFMALMGLTDEQAGEVADAMIDCVNFSAVLADHMERELEMANVPRSKLECVGSTVERTADLREVMKRQILGQDTPDLEQLMIDAFDECDINIGELVG
jgi:hypothetical protein